MHTPASRRQPSARSRMLSLTRSTRAGRGLGDVVSGVVHGVSGVIHDASDVAHDIGHAVGDVLSGKFSKIPGDIVKTGLDAVKTGKDALEVIPGALNASAGHDSGGAGSGNGDQSHGGGGDGGAQTHQDPHPTPAPGGGGEIAAAPSSRPASSPAPASTTPLPSSMSPSSEYTASAPSNSAHSVAGAINVESNTSSGHPLAEPMDPPAKTGAGQPSYGMQMLSISSATPSSTTMPGALPSNGSGGSAAAHRKGFPLAAAAALGAVLGFLVVSALFWAVWLYLRNRRRTLRTVYLPPKRMLSVTSGRTVSTVPLFISASEAGVKDDSKNPFRHPLDVHEDDPFDAASLWRSSTTRSASTLSV